MNSFSRNILIDIDHNFVGGEGDKCLKKNPQKGYNSILTLFPLVLENLEKFFQSEKSRGILK